MIRLHPDVRPGDRDRPLRPVSARQVTEVRVEVDGRTLKISNLEKVIYPRTGTTKGEVLNYYAQIAPVLLPHLADRAVTRIRWPHGVHESSFFEKNAPAGTPSWVRTAKVPTTGSRAPSRNGDHLVFPIVDDLATLTWLVNLAALELHVHQWTVTKNGQPRNPNRLVIDLDPGEPAGLMECCAVALLVRDRLAERDLDAWPVTSGSKGLHLYAALPGKLNPDATTGLAKEIAEELQKEHPKRGHRQMTKADAVRQGVPRLVAERRLQDHDLAVLPARPRHAVRRHAAHLGRGRGGCRGPARARALPVRGGPRAGRRAGRPVRHRGLTPIIPPFPDGNGSPSEDLLPNRGSVWI